MVVHTESNNVYIRSLLVRLDVPETASKLENEMVVKIDIVFSMETYVSSTSH